MVFSINLDRGVHMRSHPSMGMDVYMYVDDPGVYFDAHGNKLTSEIAEQAGFPVDDLDQKHRIKEALDAAQKQVMEQFGVAPKGPVAERDGFKVLDLGLGRYNVLGPDGSVLTKQPISKEHAMLLLDNLAPNPEKVGKKGK